MVKSTIRKWLLMTIGMAAVGVGVLGIFLPLLPTTIFLLIAAACFARSSERLYNWLLDHKWFGAYIKNWREHRAITRRTKTVMLVLLWTTLGFSAFFAVSHLLVRVLLLLIGAGVTLFILSIKTMPQETSATNL